MNRVMIPLLTTSMMTPAERAAGRFMRAPDHAPGGDTPPAGGGDSPPPQNNPSGNPADSATGGEGGDNDGQPLDLTGFWGNQDEPGPVDDSAESAAASTALGQELKTGIESFAPTPVFTKEISEQIADGNFEGINKAFADAHKASMQQSMLLTAKLVGAVVTRLQKDIDGRINGALGNRDNSAFLQGQFPLAKDPVFAPMVERVWNQALANAKGDKQKAITQTRGMLEAFGTQVNPSLRDAPVDPTAGINSPASRSLVDELLNRGG